VRVVRALDDSIQAGDVADLGATNCERTVLTEETLVLSDVATEAPDLADRAGFTEWGIACYVGTPVVANGDVYGTFCFYEDAREQVFESGYSTSKDGTGVGLSIVRRIVRAHDWDVTVTEGPDGGARFEFTGVESG